MLDRSSLNKDDFVIILFRTEVIIVFFIEKRNTYLHSRGSPRIAHHYVLQVV